MKVKKYLKNLWNNLVNDETGQYAPDKIWSWFKPITSWQESVQKRLGEPKTLTPKTPTYTPYTYRGPITTPTTPTTPTYTPFTYTGAIGQKQPPKPEKEQVIGSAGVGGAGVGGAGAGGVPMVSGFPTYSFPTYRQPDVSLNIPNFAYAPTPEQTAAMQETARTRAGLVIDPQRQAEMEALESYKSEVTGQMGEINPRMTEMSLALANMVENTMKQDIIDELIRRGATTSGELPRQLGEAGRYEVEQRRGVEEERNRLIGALQKQQLGREELSGTRLAELERMRGMQEASELFEQERYARERSMTEKSALFEAELARAQLQYGAATSQYESAYKQRLFEAEMGQQTWERGFSEQQLALQQATAAYGRQEEPNRTIPVNIEGQTVYMLPNEYMNWLESQKSSIFDTTGYSFYPGSAGFKAGQVAGMRAY